MSEDADRKARVQRAVADQVLADETICTTPVGQLTEVQVAMLNAVLVGPHADEILAHMDQRIASFGQPEGKP